MQTQVIGLVGLGLVGQALGARLRANGLRVVGHDLRPEAVEAFRAQGGESATSLAQLGEQVDTVVLAVFDTQGVLEVVEGADGLLTGASRIRRVVDCSTGDPAEVEALSRRLRARGIDFVEAPLSGSSQQIAAGEGVALVGAEEPAWQAARPLLSMLAAECIHVGPPGMGAKAKLATNLVLGLNRAVLAEGMAFAESLGIAPQRFLSLVLATPARSDAAAVKGPLMAAGDFAPRSRIRQHRKDVMLMLDAAAAAGLELPFSRVHAALLSEAVEQGRGELDNAAIVLQMRGRKVGGGEGRG
ncbi:NAD(P)-dependent oxidoreductase [Ramlibacter sp.]|uniref:NAD(P)-dependent oxidoreductase n=1 Tax=Ramlibacter sp. TaxID=1917967 RepID=UPI003D13A132